MCFDKPLVTSLVDYYDSEVLFHNQELRIASNPYILSTISQYIKFPAKMHHCLPLQAFLLMALMMELRFRKSTVNT